MKTNKLQTLFLSFLSSIFILVLIPDTKATVTYGIARYNLSTGAYIGQWNWTTFSNGALVGQMPSSVDIIGAGQFNGGVPYITIQEADGTVIHYNAQTGALFDDPAIVVPNTVIGVAGDNDSIGFDMYHFDPGDGRLRHMDNNGGITDFNVTTFSNGPLAGTNISDATVLDFVSYNSPDRKRLFALDIDGSILEYNLINGALNLVSDLGETSVTGGAYDSLTYSHLVSDGSFLGSTQFNGGGLEGLFWVPEPSGGYNDNNRYLCIVLQTL